MSLASNVLFSTAQSPEFIRNIGIIAHIDAGKTTTTERMLFNAGMISRPGNVDAGNTIMDHLRQERARGITITSAIISFPWLDKFRINLIDTPGHVDFTVEVERSLRVLDSAVAIVDGVSGVEAQTETVWLQSNRYKLPRIIFVNKLDREDFSIKDVVSQIRMRLSCPTAIPIQKGHFEINAQALPSLANEFKFPWLIDLITLDLVGWPDCSSSQLVKIPFGSWSRKPLFASNSFAPLQSILSARQELLERLSENDDALLEAYLENASHHEKIPHRLLSASIKRSTTSGTLTPILYGASLKNWGIQPLLDAIVRYLPSPRPLDNPFPKSVLGVAFVFKVVFDEKKGLMAFARIYHGEIRSKTMLLNTSKGIKERLSKILHMTSDEGKEISAVTFGNLAVFLGLKGTATGDTLIALDSESRLSKFAKPAAKEYALPELTVPKPVFFRSVHAENTQAEETLVDALRKIELEDPSFKFERNLESGQLLISGMGSLHLEVIADRLAADFGCKFHLGQMNIAYKTSISRKIPFSRYFVDEKIINREVLGKMLHSGISLSIEPVLLDQGCDVIAVDNCNNQVLFDESFLSDELLEFVNNTWKISIDDLKKLITEHADASLANGPIQGFPCIGTRLKIHKLLLFSDSSIPSIRAVLSEAIKDAFSTNHASYSLFEPLMSVRIRAPKEHLGVIISDISTSGRGMVHSVEDELLDNNSCGPSTRYVLIAAEIPLATMAAYSTHLRSISSGTASFTSSLLGYAECPKTQA